MFAVSHRRGNVAAKPSLGLAPWQMGTRNGALGIGFAADLAGPRACVPCCWSLSRGLERLGNIFCLDRWLCDAAYQADLILLFFLFRMGNFSKRPCGLFVSHRHMPTSTFSTALLRLHILSLSISNPHPYLFLNEY